MVGEWGGLQMQSDHVGLGSSMALVILKEQVQSQCLLGSRLEYMNDSVG